MLDPAHGRYKVAVAVLRALMQHDDELERTLRDIRASAGRVGRPPTREDVERDFPYFFKRIDISALGETVSLDTLWAAIRTIVDLSTDTWDERFGELEAYKEEHGDCNVPRTWDENESLGQWVIKQRIFKRQLDAGGKREITQERIDRLEGIGFEWEPDAAIWNQRFGELQAYKERVGDCKVPAGWRDNPQLAAWVNHHRQEKRKFDLGVTGAAITQERIAKLDEIEFEWDPVLDLWDRRFGELVEYKERFGDCKVPLRWDENATLGKWVGGQRVQKKKFDKNERATITQERIDRLNAIEFVWDLDAAFWEERFRELEAYQEEHGHCRVPRDGSELGGWVHNQRARKRKFDQNKLRTPITQEHINRLNAIGFEWDLVVARGGWEQHFGELEAYKARFGDCNVPRGWSENRTLASWVATQRSEKRKRDENKQSTITQERIDRLDAIGLEWTRPRGAASHASGSRS